MTLESTLAKIGIGILLLPFLAIVIGVVTMVVFDTPPWVMGISAALVFCFLIGDVVYDLWAVAYPKVPDETKGDLDGSVSS